MGTHFSFYPVDRRGALEIKVAEYVFEQTEPTPWTPLRRPLRECRAAVVTTAGVRLATQHQFSCTRTSGSAEIREISAYVSPAQLAFDFTNYDPSEAQEDLNVLVPVERMRELAEEKVLGGVTETFFSFFGLCENLAALRGTAACAVERLRAQEVDVVFVFPANLVCNQTGGIVAREIERAGIATVMLAGVREIVEQVRVPRAVFVNFPFGRPLGRAGDRATQRRILDEMAAALCRNERPGRIRDLDLVWEGEVV
ncbi:MAG: hypothetical protein HYY17_13885 [Planctomycetes bacterium]|nr:hypothetical protein [Planctomycetota bacterium]